MLILSDFLGQSFYLLAKRRPSGLRPSEELGLVVRRV